jgi:hypothetical protein
MTLLIIKNKQISFSLVHVHVMMLLILIRLAFKMYRNLEIARNRISKKQNQMHDYKMILILNFIFTTDDMSGKANKPVHCIRRHFV